MTHYNVSRSIQNEHVGRIAHIVVSVDHQDVRIHPGRREMPVGGRVSQIGRRTAGQTSKFHGRPSSPLTAAEITS